MLMKTDYNHYYQISQGCSDTQLILNILGCFLELSAGGKTFLRCTYIIYD